VKRWALVVVAAGLLAGCTSQAGLATDSSSEASPTTPALATAAWNCLNRSQPGLTVGDSGKTVTLDSKGNDDADGVSYEQIACVLRALSTPDSVLADIDQTRALDGRQEASWGSYSAVWRYHPDSGLELILTQA